MNCTDIANVLGVGRDFVQITLRSYRNAGFRWPLLSPSTKAPRKFSEEQTALMTSLKLIKEQAAMTLDDRVKDIKDKFDIDISIMGLWKIY